MKKKISAVLLITVLASGLVFAGITGNAQVGFGGNLDNHQFGFIDNSTNVTFNIDVATADAAAKAEGKVYAEINGSVKLYLTNGEKGGSSMSDPSLVDSVPGTDGKGNVLGIQAKIDSAKIVGSNWYVSLLGVPGGPDFAKSAIDTYKVKKQYDDLGLVKKDQTKNATYSVGYSKAPGVEFGIAGYKFGLGLFGDFNKDEFMKHLNATAYAMTPEYALADGMTLQVGAVYSQKYLDPDAKWVPVADPAQAVGGSVKFAYESDSVKASVASDIGYDLIKGAGTEAEKKEALGADVALNVAVAPVTVDVYFATKAKTGETPKADPKKTEAAYTYNLLSAQVVADLNSFDVPVKLTVTGKDLIAKQDLALAVAVTPMDGLTLTAKGGYVIANNGRNDGGAVVEFNDTTGKRIGKWSAGLDAEYKMDAFTVSGGFGVRNASTSKFSAGNDADSLVISAKAAVESATLVPGATLKLAWAGDDLTKTLLASETADDNGQLGKVVASCKIAF